MKRKYSPEVRQRTLPYIEPFEHTLRRLAPWAVVRVVEPEHYEIAGTVYVSHKHIDARRELDVEGTEAVYARMSEDEQAKIAAAVGEAASEVGVEVRFKQSASAPHTLVYRIWKS